MPRCSNALKLCGIALTALFALAPLRPAFAQSLEEAQVLMDDGQFLAAARIGWELDTSDGLALAAKALAIYGHEMAPEEERQELFELGAGYAKRAITLDPRNSEAYLQGAHTLGRYAQGLSTLDALAGGYAEQIKELLDTAVELDPANVDALINLGAWHAVVVENAGFVSDMLYGASEAEALAAYHRALEIAPDYVRAHYEYAIGLIKLGDNEIERARAHLEHAIRLPARTVVDFLVQDEARQRLAALPER